MSLLQELKDRWEATTNKAHAAECHSIELYAQAEELSRAIAALEPAPEHITADNVAEFVADKYQQVWGDVDYTEQDGTRVQQELEDIAPTSSPSTDEGRSVPGAEENAGTILDEPEIPAGFRRWEGGSFDDFCAVQTVYATTDVDVRLRAGGRDMGLASDMDWEHSLYHTHPNDIIAYRIISQPADQSEDEPAEHISILTGDPAVEPETGLHGEPVVELAVEDYLAALAPASTSVLDDPELIEAQKRLTARLEADTLAQVQSYWSDDVRAPAAPLQPEPTGYIGLQDAELDAEFDAMKEREKADKPKLHFSIFGERGNRKLEDVE